MSKNKHKVDIDNSKNIYDFTHFKITHMIEALEKQYGWHPDIDALQNILECYEEGSITIFWEGGFPMPDIPDF
jgi:hypothetical protein